MRKGLRLALGSGLMFGLLATLHATEPLSLVTNQGTVLACTGCDVPGMPAFTVFGTMEQVQLADDGTVVFFSDMAGPGITGGSSQAVFEGTTLAGLTVVARSSDAAPDLPGLRLVNNPETQGITSNALRVSPDGRTLFVSRLTNDGNNLPTTNDTGLFGGFAGSLGLVAREGDPAPGTAGALFGDLLNLSLQFDGINRNGRVMFRAPLVGGDVVGTTNNDALYTGTPGALTTAVRKGDTMLPGPVTAATIGFSNFLMTDDRILYTLKLSGAGVTAANDDSVWLNTPGSGNALLLREGDPAPGTTGAVFSGDFLLSSKGVTGSGRFQFVASLAGGDATTANDQAIYLADTTGAATLLAREGAPAPGTNATFGGFSPQYSNVNSAGFATIQARLTGGTVDSTNDNGIWAGTPGSLSLVARVGITPIPGAPSGSVCKQISNSMAFSDYGLVLFCELDGPYIYPFRNSKALVAWTPTAGLFLAWRQGQDLEILPGTSRPQTYATPLAFGNTDGAALGLSHTGELAMTVGLDPGVSVVTIDLDCYPSTDYYLDADGDGHGDPTTELNLCAGGAPPPGYITTSGDCLDSDPAAQGTSPEVCNGIDDDCNGRIDDGIPRPTGVPTMTMSKSGGTTTLLWNAVPNATSYDIVYGSLQELRNAGGHYQFLTQAVCWANDFVGTSITMPANPGPGQGQFWLMRAVNCSGFSSYDEGVPSQVIARNQEISASQYQCP